MACFLSVSDHMGCSSCSCLNTPYSKGDDSGLANSDFDSRRVFTISTSNLAVMLVSQSPFFYACWCYHWEIEFNDIQWVSPIRVLLYITSF
jgi:hypothetical protein